MAVLAGVHAVLARAVAVSDLGESASATSSILMLAQASGVPAAITQASEAVSGPYWVVIAAAVPSIASGAWVFYQHWSGRKDKRNEGALTREQALMRDMDARAQFLSKENADLLKEVRLELSRIVARLADVERERNAAETDRDRWEWLARWWYRKADSLRHMLNNAYMVKDSLLVKLNLPVPERTPVELPPLEGPT